MTRSCLGARFAILSITLVACGGASAENASDTAPAQTASAASASPSASGAPIASATATPVEERAAPPANYRIVSGDGFSIFVPSAWQPMQVAPGAQAFKSAGGDDEGMTLQIAKVAFVGPENDFVAGTTQGATMKGAKQTGSSAITVAGRQVPVTAFTSTQPGPTIRGVIRATSGSDSLIVVTCHTMESIWNDKARAQCDPIFASIRAAPASTATPPAGKRFLSGNDFRVTIPAAWGDVTAHAPDTRALAQSSSDENTMIVVTVQEIAPDEKPTPKNRDELLQKAAKSLLARDGMKGSIKRASPNQIDLDFTRKLEGPTSALVLAHFFATDAAYLVTCGGLRQTMEAHREICETSVRSMRLEHPK